MNLPDYQDSLRRQTLQVLIEFNQLDHRREEAVQADYRFAGMHMQNDLFDLDFRYLNDDNTVIHLLGG